MKKLYSLIKACMTSDMNLFKIKTKNNSKKNKIILPLFISLCFMFSIWTNANLLFEKIAPLHLQYVVLSLVVFLTSIMTIVEGIYKSGSLIFNSKDDQLLLSLPIERRTVLFVRIFKFYVFEFIFNSLFIIPLIIAYLRWADSIEWSFFLTSLVMIIFLPIIPIVISCLIGSILSSVSSRFKYKNLVQTVTSILFILIIIYLSYNLDGLYNYILENATSINDLITKIYYPAGIYAKLVTNFNVIDLLIFIVVHIIIFVISIIILSKFYFKINSRLKSVTASKKINVSNLSFKSKSIYSSLIKKELSNFFNTPVFIINAGLGLVLFVIATIIITLKFDIILSSLSDFKDVNITKDLIENNLSILVFILLSFTSYMTSITNSVISLEGKNINILKSLPIKIKTILLSKIFFGLVITSPVILLGNIILCVKLKISILESILLLILSILIPLVSHFIGLIVNLKYPKLDAENSTEVVKQSTSSFISVMIGMLLALISIVIITNIVGLISSKLILLLGTVIYIIIDLLLYFYLIKVGVKDFNNLSI